MFWLIFGILLIACAGAGTTGGMFPPGPWYRELRKAAWTPPDWVFPLVWSLLYLCMSYAGALIATQPSELASLALALWAAQIAFNGLWTPIFFGLQKLRAGMIVLVALWLLVLATLVAFWMVDSLAGVLFVPYLVWVSIAGALNWQVIKLNPDATP